MPRRDAILIFEVGAPLSLPLIPSDTKRSLHRVNAQASIHPDLPSDSTTLPFAIVGRDIVAEAIPSTQQANSEAVPDWKALLLAWGEQSQEYIIAISHMRVVLYVSRAARKPFSLHPGSILDENWEEEILRFWMIEMVDIGTSAAFRLLQFRPRTSYYAKSTELFPAIQTNSSLFQAQLKTAAVAALSQSNTLLLGETGSGKEVLARAIHASSSRKNGPFIAVNMACLPRELIASELFGYTDGAFTGAKRGGHVGKFEAASTGTLFLDEIGEMPLDLQVMLLRVLEERSVMRLGSHDEKPLDVRIIAATNRKLDEEVRAGRFRADLYYRLNVLQICIPPLRDRKEDIAPLAQGFLKQLQDQYAAGPTELSGDVVGTLLQHTWPGNVRELRNAMERAFLLAFYEKVITAGHLPIEWRPSSTPPQNDAFTKEHSLLRDAERHTIQQAITEAQTLSAAAKKLGCARSTLYRKMRELGINHFN
ncbi:sigma-54 interaction domain-containing protein [Brevibacillus reuszeri]|uniref:sigma-54 interaction domain-containing protein n=1 Tax=Brevibacillus reuszeri TaxID=54915 RepID=UPI000A02ED68|nr:sigma 54-interacting transcriptional regulator [Brevibacillus reuszeri]MED1860991.1 sigma 54-interacting transcriptional regulator [Brevibacillus reuszeri]